MAGTIASIPSAQVTTTSGTQTVNVSWTNPFGSYSSNIYRCLASTNCLNTDGNWYIGGPWYRVAEHVAGTRVLRTPKTYPPRWQLPNVSGTGSTVINKAGLYSTLVQLAAIAAPSGVANAGLIYFDSTAECMKIINNNGSPSGCVGGGAGAFTSVQVTGTTALTACGTATGCIAFGEFTNVGTPTAGQIYCRADGITNQLLCSYNGSSEQILGMLAGLYTVSSGSGHPALPSASTVPGATAIVTDASTFSVGTCTGRRLRIQCLPSAMGVHGHATKAISFNPVSLLRARTRDHLLPCERLALSGRQRFE